MRARLLWTLAVGCAVLAALPEARAEDTTRWAVPGGPACDPTDIICEGCCRKRDACGWPLDPCGVPYGRWDVGVEGTVSFTELEDEPLGLETGASDQIRWDTLNYGAAFGVRGLFQLAFTPYDRIQARGGWYGSWSEADTKTGVFGFSPPFTVTAVGTAALSSEADLVSAELSWVRELVCCGVIRLEGIVGFRAVSLQETATASIATTAGGVPLVASVTSDASNVFLGGQLGAAGRFDMSACLEMTLSGKVLLGSLAQEIQITDTGLFTPGSKTITEEEAPFHWGLDCELGFLWRISPRFSVTFGYQALFMADVVRANRAMNFGRFDSGAVQPIFAKDNLLVHTVFAGVQVNF
jgi:hypothetical protein